MEAVIQLRADLARLMQGDAVGAWPNHLAAVRRDLDAELSRLGASLRPMHPGVKDTELARYFTLTGIPDPQQETVLATLRNLEAVTAAYVKPEAEPA